jgi:hypothetical protein
MKRKMTVVAPIALALVTLAGGLVAADSNSYFDKGYEFTTLRAAAIRNEIKKDLQANGFEPVTPGQRADFLVAYYAGLKEKYDVRVNTIDMKKPDKRLDKAVDSLVKKFMRDRDERS